MRFRTHSPGGDIVAVTGVNTVSFALLTTPVINAGLLGFAVERTDPVADEKYFMAGYKVFQSVMPNPAPLTSWSAPTTSRCRASCGTTSPPSLIRTTPTTSIRSRASRRTSTARSTADDHGADRAALHRQRARRLLQPRCRQQPGLRTPVRLRTDRQARRRHAGGGIDWLTRDLDDALLKFIDDDRRRATELLGCFYEFAYPPATDALLRAIARGVDVQLVIDEKDNAEQFPLEENQNELARSHFPAARVTARTARS